MRVLKRILPALLVVVMIIGVALLSRLTASAALINGGMVYAGEVATITCYGGALWQQTNIMFKADRPTMGYVTRYGKDGEQVSQRQICGLADFYDLSVTGGETYTVEIYVGAMQISYITANTINPMIEIIDGGINMEPIVKTNLYPSSELYLTPGETGNLYIQQYYPGSYFELDPQSYRNSAYSSDNMSVVTIDDKGQIMALKEGEARLKIYYKFGFSEEEYFSTNIETVVYVVGDGIDEQIDNCEHVPVQVWTNDINEHWHVCSACGGKVDISEHTYVEKPEVQYLKSAASCIESAVYCKSCSVCGYASEETFICGDLLPHTYYRLDDSTVQCSVCGFKQSCGDVNGDGEIDIADITLLAKYIAGWNVSLGPRG